MNNTREHSATAVGSLWWFADALYRHGPSWQLVPPLLLGAAALINALRAWRRETQELRHKEDLHRAEMAARAKLAFVPKLETPH